MTQMNNTQPHLDALISSIEHAEDIVKRMETTTGNVGHSLELHGTLSMHRFILKVYAILIIVLTFAGTVGGILVSRIISEEEQHQAGDASKYGNMVAVIKEENTSNKVMIEHLIKLIEETHQETHRKNDTVRRN